MYTDDTDARAVALVVRARRPRARADALERAFELCARAPFATRPLARRDRARAATALAGDVDDADIFTASRPSSSSEASSEASSAASRRAIPNPHGDIDES